jgi:hypothetical protein
MAGLFFFVLFKKIAPRVSIFKDKNNFPANLEILPREVAVAVESAHSLVPAFVLFPADIELPSHPRGQAIAVPHSPPLASPLDILLMMIGKELLLDFEDEPLQSIHAIGAPFRSHNHTQFGA